MTDIVASLPAEGRFAGQLADAERQVRAFLMTATRYLASGTQRLALDRIGNEAIRSPAMTADEFDRMLLGTWQNQGK
jgi:hypothetical protein